MGILEVCPCDHTPNQTPMPQDDDKNMDKSPLRNTLEQDTTEDNLNDLREPNANNAIVKITQKPSDNCFERYDIVDYLGTGTLGSTKKVKLKSGNTIRAMKIISKWGAKDGTSFTDISEEISVLKLLDHPNIVKVIEYYETTDEYFIIQEFCNKGKLGDSNGSSIYYPEFMVKFIMQKLLSGVEYIHSMNLVHGDIKLENILLNIPKEIPNTDLSFQDLADKANRRNLLSKELNNPNTEKFSKEAESLLNLIKIFEIKLGDVGYNNLFNQTRKTFKNKDNLYYFSPELTKGEQTLESDEWACGIVMYLLLTGNLPFTGTNEDELFSQIRKNKPNFKMGNLKNVSEECLNLLKNLLNPDSRKRIKAKDALKEPFFTGNTFDYLICDKETKAKSLYSSSTSRRKNKGNIFKENVIAYIILKYVNKDELKLVKRILSNMQQGDLSKKCSKEDFLKIIKANMKNYSEEEAEEIFDKIDFNKNNYLEISEILKAICNFKNLLTKNILEKAFESFGEDESNCITWGEINEVVFGGENFGYELLTDFLTLIGKNKDDPITFDEFCEIINE